MTNGQTISHYRIIGEIGRGGMGVVYKALDLNLGRTVALKFLPPHLSSDEERKKRFVQEAKAASALDHANIGTIYEFNETKDGQLFIAMAYYEGEVLQEILEDRPLDIGTLIDIIGQICLGLSAAHKAGIVHRDVKPSNIIVTKDGGVKIIDFGLAKSDGRASITNDASTKGTIDYMSPEQSIGESVDYRTDIWSLGVLFYEMTTGKRPFKGEYDQAVIYSILKENPKPPAEINSSIPSIVQDAILKALQKTPADRFENMDDFRAALLPHRQNEKRAAFFHSMTTYIRKNKKRAAMTIAAMVLLLAAAATTLKLLPKNQQFVLGIASFWGADETEIRESKRMHANVMRMLTDELADDPEIKLVGLPNYMLLSEKEATTVGEKIDASAIIWGEVLTSSDIVEFQPFVTIIEEPNLRPETAERDPLKALKIGFAEPNQIITRKAKAQDIVNLALQTAGTFFSASNPDKSIQLYKKIEPLNSTAAYLMGDAFINKEQWEQARDYFEKAIALDSTDAKPHVGLARYHDHLNNLAEAITELEKAKKYAPQTWWPSSFLAVLHNYLYDFGSALEEAKNAAALNPELAEVQGRLGNIYWGLADYEQAIQHWEKAKTLDPDFTKHLMIATGYLKMGRIEEARAAAERRFAELAPAREKPNRLVFEALVNMVHGDYAGAAQLLQNILKEQPDNQYAIGRLGCCYSYDGQVEKAISWWKEAKQRFPNNQWFPHDLGFTYIDIGEYDLAAAEFEKALAINPYQQYHYIGLAAVHYSQGLHDQAVKVFERALNILPESLFIRLYYALELYHVGRNEEARAQLAEFSSNPYAESWRFPIKQLLLGKISGAQTLAALRNIFPLKYEENLKRAPFAAGAFSEVYYYLAMSTLFNLGKDSESPDIEKAISYLEKALAHTNVNDSTYPYVKAELKKLQTDNEFVSR